MTWTPKPSNRAFIVAAAKAENFLNDKRSSGKATLDRYYAHHPEKRKETSKQYDGKQNI